MHINSENMLSVLLHVIAFTILSIGYFTNKLILCLLYSLKLRILETYFKFKNFAYLDILNFESKICAMQT